MGKNSLRIIALAAVVMAFTTAATPPQSAHALAGTYACHDTDNNGPGWNFTSVNTPFGEWIRAVTSFPPQNGTRAQVSEAFVGYERDAKRWHIVVINDDGSYYTRSSTSALLNGSHWTDREPADGGQAQITLPDANHYVFDFHQEVKNGKMEHQRVVCTKTAGTSHR